MGPADAILNGIDLDYIERVEVVRGPGSVTLGQGALLGVVNVITRDVSATPHARAGLSLGADQLVSLRGAAVAVAGKATARLYLSRTVYGGQPLRPEGWATVQENPPGVTVFDRGHRLKASDATLAILHLETGGWWLRGLYADQLRDNYEFYRDREETRQALASIDLGYRRALGQRVELRLGASFARDEFGSYSHSGVAMAGTREDRLGVDAVATVRDLLPGNRLAVGAELRRFEMGKSDRFGNNLLVNNLADRARADNQSNTYVNRTNIEAAGVFVELAHDFGRVDAFAGLRLDLHPFWGAQLSPRAGVIAAPNDQLSLRLSYQSGFRGAVGVHYTGGWRRDGLLHEDSFAAVEANPFVAAAGFEDLEATAPESLRTAELGFAYRPLDGLALDGVAFASWLDDLIGVGVIYLGDEPGFDELDDAQLQIGDDRIGDWGGWFYFGNNPGTIASVGTELSATYARDWFELGASYALARVVSVPDSLIGSEYVSGSADEPHFRAYPETVVRVAGRLRPCDRCWLGAVGVYYGPWYSPDWSGGPADGDSGSTLNLTGGYRFARGLELSAAVKNALDVRRLWPMNSNADDPSVSPGSPALETRTFWVSASYAL
jgi:outer membrane receptor protein involved in Fe transport